MSVYEMERALNNGGTLTFSNEGTDYYILKIDSDIVKISAKRNGRTYKRYGLMSETILKLQSKSTNILK